MTGLCLWGESSTPCPPLASDWSLKLTAIAADFRCGASAVTATFRLEMDVYLHSLSPFTYIFPVASILGMQAVRPCRVPWSITLRHTCEVSRPLLIDSIVARQTFIQFVEVLLFGVISE